MPTDAPEPDDRAPEPDPSAREVERPDLRGSGASRLRELAAVFGRLGIVGFGGPAAHIALVREEIVRRRGWLTDEELIDLVGASSLIPGPTSTEVAIHVGHRRAGWPGLVVAGLAFILPAVAIVSALAWAYVEFGTLPAAGGLLAGVAPVVVAIVVHALVGLGRAVLRTPLPVAIVAGAVAAAWLGAPELVVLLGGAAVAVAAHLVATRDLRLAAVALLGLTGTSTAAAAAAVTPSAWAVFVEFAKIGSLLFGSGYVLIAYLQTGLVEQLGWLTEQQLLDAVAVGQVTPGPVFSTATFVGWVVAGPAGAVAATIGIFLPAFVFVALSVPLLPRMRRSPVASAFLDGVNGAAIGLIAVVAVQLAVVAIPDVLALVVAIAALALLVSGRLGPVALILAGGTIGVVVRLVAGT